MKLLKISGVRGPMENSLQAMSVCMIDVPAVWTLAKGRQPELPRRVRDTTRRWRVSRRLLLQLTRVSRQLVPLP